MGGRHLAVKDSQESPGTVGIYNSETKQFEKGIELKVDPRSTVGVYNPETGKWEGGITVKDSANDQIGTVGNFNQDSQTWEHGTPDVKLQRRIEQATVGSYNQDSKTWEGGIEVDQPKPGEFKTVEYVKSRGVPKKVLSGECALTDCISCPFEENICEREKPS